MTSQLISIIKLGSQGLQVSAQGLDCISMSTFSGQPKSDSHTIVLVHHAINCGVTLFDTSDNYSQFASEILVGKALKGGLRGKVELATKFGVSYAHGKMEIHGDPGYARATKI